VFWFVGTISKFNHDGKVAWRYSCGSLLPHTSLNTCDTLFAPSCPNKQLTDLIKTGNPSPIESISAAYWQGFPKISQVQKCEVFAM